MSAFVVYDMSTGRVLRNLDIDESLIELQIGPGEGYVRGKANGLCCRIDIDTKQVIEFVPSSPHPDLEWHPGLGDFRATAEAEARNAARGVIVSTEMQTLRAMRDWILSVGGGDQAALAKLAKAEEDIAVQRPSVTPDKEKP